MGNITTRQDTTTLSPRSAGILSDSPIEEISNDSKLPPYHHGRVLKLDYVLRICLRHPSSRPLHHSSDGVVATDGQGSPDPSSRMATSIFSGALVHRRDIVSKDYKGRSFIAITRETTSRRLCRCTSCS